MAGYKCAYCGKVSGTTKENNTEKEKPTLSDKGCKRSGDGKHKWIKK